jgi:hypothetical protein
MKDTKIAKQQGLGLVDKEYTNKVGRVQRPESRFESCLFKIEMFFESEYHQ